MTNQQFASVPAGSVPTVWQLRTYDVWGNAKDGWQVNDSYDAGEITLRIPQTRYNVGVYWHVCCNPECPGNRPCEHVPPCPGGHPRESHGVIPDLVNGAIPACPECAHVVSMESREFTAAYPSLRQIKRAFGVTCRIELEGDDLHIEVTRQRDGYPIGEMLCVSHENLSPVRKARKVNGDCSL